MDQNIWEYDDFIFKGDELKGMTAKDGRWSDVLY